MGVQFAYGKLGDINDAILNGVIPRNSIIVTRDDETEAGLLFYDTEAILKGIVYKTRFKNDEEALAYIAANDMVGRTITLLENGRYNAYSVQVDGSLSAIEAGDVDPATINALIKSAHAHDNKTLLDSITEERVKKWDDADGGIIDTILINGAALEINDGSVDIPVATAVQCGVIKGSSAENSITILPDGTTQINSINVNKLVQDADDELIFICGSST